MKPAEAGGIGMGAEIWCGYKKDMPSCFAAKGHTLSFHYLISVSQ